VLNKFAFFNKKKKNQKSNQSIFRLIIADRIYAINYFIRTKIL